MINTIPIILFLAQLQACPAIVQAQTSNYADYDENRLCEAIGRAENSVKYPYGIKSVQTNGDKAYARKICLNSIRNNKKRWIIAGKKEDFIAFMARRYAPLNATDDPKGLNVNWTRNVLYHYNKGK